MSILSYNMDITETGHGLHVLITTEPGKDWETFCTWYSVYKNLPEAIPAIASKRNGQVPFQFFQWAKRLKIQIFHHDPLSPDDSLSNNLEAVRLATARGLLGKNVLVLPYLTAAIEILDQNMLEEMNSKKIWINGDVMFMRFNNYTVSDLLNNYLLQEDILANFTEGDIGQGALCMEAKETRKVSSIVSYRNGCGKWIDTSKGCPLSSAAGLALTTMTVNENRIIELWKKMCTLYSATV